MNYHYSPRPISESAKLLAGRIARQLYDHKRVLWLLSGGSGIDVCVEAANLLNSAPLHLLTVVLTDERYGEPEHANENWQQLLDKGFVLEGAQTYRILSGKDRATTTKEFNEWLKKELQATDFTIGLFGIGTDAHTAGIKPHSVAVTSHEYVADFDGEDFERITITPKVFPHIHEVVIQANGEDKKPIIETLLHEATGSVTASPMTLLSTVPVATLVTNISVRA